MAESHVVSGLVAKRGELAGEAERCRRELHRLADELGHLDATIRLFAPDYDLGGIRARRRRRASPAGSGRGNASVWCWKSCGMPPGRCRTKA